MSDIAGADPQSAAGRRQHEVQNHRVALRLGQSLFRQLHRRHVSPEVAEGVVRGTKMIRAARQNFYLIGFSFNINFFRATPADFNQFWLFCQMS